MHLPKRFPWPLPDFSWRLQPVISALPALLLVLLAGCSSFSNPLAAKPRAVYQNERFQSDETYSRLFDAGVDETCEAARRALLSQGFLISSGDTAGQIAGSKRFQPNGEDHVEINFTVVCVPDGKGASVSTAYVSAQQDRYVIKRSANSASVGVGAIGSISVPLSSSQDSLVKVASETIPAGEFYDRFFALMQRMLKELANDRAAG